MSYAAYADREGRCGIGLVWIIQENKHIGDTRFEQGDIQLATCMLAAFQENQDKFKLATMFPMIGVKFYADNIAFYKMRPSEEYLVSLKNGYPNEDLIISKSDLLCLSDPTDREAALCYLWQLREQALLLPVL